MLVHVLDGLERRLEVDLAGAGVRTGGAHRRRRADQGGLDLVRREVGPGLQEQGRRAADDRRGLAGAGAAKQPLGRVTGDEALGVVAVDRGPWCPEADDGRAGRRQVGVPRAGRALAEVRQQGLVPAGDLAERVARADGQDKGVQRRVRHGRRPRTVVTHAGDDDDSGTPGGLDRGGQGVALVGLQRLGAEGEVDDAHVHAVVVAVRGGPREPGDDRVDRRGAVGTGQLQRQELGVRG